MKMTVNDDETTAKMASKPENGIKMKFLKKRNFGQKLRGSCADLSALLKMS